MSEESDIIKKIRETKRETAELQHQLQNLIDEGKNLSCFSKPKPNYKDEEKPIQSTNKQQIIPSYDKRNAIRPDSSPVGKEEVKTESPKKTRTYDVKQTREYMKKQKERLIVKQKQTQDERKIKADIQKKKLEELHRKSRELLAKNVQAKRERSKSRDNNIYVRPDDAVRFPSNLGKAKSLDRVDILTPQKQKNPSSLYPPDLTKGSFSLNQKGDQDKILILARNYTRPGQGVISKSTNLDPNSNLAATNTQLNGHSPGTINKEQVDIKNKLQLKQQTTSKKLGSINKDLRYKPKVLFKSSEGDEVVSASEALKNESKHSNKSNFSANGPSLNIVPLEKVEEKIKPFEINNGSARIDPLTIENKGVLVDRKKNLKCSKSVPEIQKENAKKYPSWLQEQPPQADPFNFINTIKRKLQAASMPKPTTDVGIQSSFFETAYIGETFPTEEESRGPELLQKSDLKSFNSHNRLNLDSRTIDHLELVPRKSYDQGTARHTTYSTSENESESDTSKNIPEISSESGTSLKKNAESVRKIATKTLSLTTDSNVPSLSTGLLSLPSRSKSPKSTNTRYVEDFDSDSDFEASSESLERSRRSVITFNKPEYNEVAISPLKSFSTINTETIPSRNLDTSKFVGDLQENSDSRSKTSSKPTDFEKNTEKSNRNQVQDHDKMSSSKNSSVHRDPQPSTSSTTTTASKSNSSVRNINTTRGSGSFNGEDKSEILLLVEPTASLVRNSKDTDDSERSKKKLKNISVKSSRILANGTKNDTNQIHLKFEAEIHLLNDFNESLKRFSALEQAVETLKINNSISSPNILENKSAQPSLTSRTKTFSKISEHLLETKNNHNQFSHVNYSRGSFINSSLEDLNQLTNSALDLENSIFSTGLDISNINQSLSLKTDDQPTNFENLHPANFVGVSINMFDQLIKDEDTRLENLKAILKIREQALLDRTKGELAWLEIQRKHFKETGKLHEASVVKKKQRGILVNHQKEKHEMQRLKQMQKVASIERKIVLKEQRNLIRQQLFTNNNILTKVKVNTPREKRLSGPLKVLQSHTESIRSETSISRKSSVDKDFASVNSHQSFVSRQSMVTEISGKTFSSKDNVTSLEHHKFIKKTLLMREAALKRRRKAAEELLQWHKKLLDEEKRIAVLESTASAIISQKPNKSTAGDFNFKGKQLNQLWFNLTGSDAKKFADDKIYLMSQRALESFCKNAREFNTKKGTPVEKTEVQTDCSVSERIATPEKDYMSDFENESIKSAKNDIVDQSIDLLINNFNQIQDDISALSVIQTKRSDESIAGGESSVIKITSAYFKDGETASSSPSEILSSANIGKTRTSDIDIDDTVSEEISELTGNRHPDQTVSHKSTSLSEEIDVAEGQILSKSTVTSENKSDSSSGLDESDSQKIVTDKTSWNSKSINEESSLETLPQISDPELSIKANLLAETKELVEGQTDPEPVQDSVKEEDAPTIASEESSGSHAVEESPKSALNESQEILLILGEDEVKTRSDEEQTGSDEDLLKLKDSLHASKEILSKLSEQAQEEDQTTESVDDPMSQSLLKLYQISETDNPELETFSMLEVPNSIDKNSENVDESFQDGSSGEKLEEHPELEETDMKSSLPFKIDENNENQTFLNNLVASSTEMNIQQYIHEESDESKLTLSDKSNESFVINEINDNSDEKVEENSVKKTTDECRSITEDVNEESEVTKTTSHFEYGVLPKSEETETLNSSAFGFPPSKEEIHSSEDKEHDSLSNCESSSEALSLEEQSLPPSEGSSSIKEDISTKSKNKSSDDVPTFKEVSVDVKKRVSEILAETNISRGDKSPRLQDLYVTTYDLISPANSPEKGTSSPREEHKLVSSIFDSEAEEILRKQLAVEEEIKAITEQQQKHQVPHIYIREIPNKPPPPYTPPSATVSPPVPTIIPSAEEIEEITMYSAKILHKAYLSNNLTNVNISNNTLSLISKDIPNDCYKFVFNLCKDIAREHYKQFEEDDSPPWLRMAQHREVSFVKPLDPEELKTHMIKVLKELFGYQKPTRRENTIIKWSRKKRDHVDEILVMECQQEESQWTDYQKDELLVKDEITNDIFDSLLKDTARVLQNIFSKRRS